MEALANMVYLIGAGPGDPDLITVAGLKALQRCTAIVHDALISEEMLALARPEALRIAMGKRGYGRKADQADINTMLIELSQAGHIVARLKGGDPFVFGRGGEEVEALVHAGIAFQVIPGISSALAAPAALNIPVTHRELAASFVVVTAQRAEGAVPPHWPSLVQIDTLIILMGASHIGEIAQVLIEAGRTAHTPVAAIQSATLPDERFVIGTLASIGDDVKQAGLGAPLVIVVGEVVRLHHASTVAQFVAGARQIGD